ncbi:MAG: hypothetical protein GX882_05915 [Methanomicrobiales archaeon]|nr:hypothetical protein [Methanomicrobiales archaeon]
MGFRWAREVHPAQRGGPGRIQAFCIDANVYLLSPDITTSPGVFWLYRAAFSRGSAL